MRDTHIHERHTYYELPDSQRTLTGETHTYMRDTHIMRDTDFMRERHIMCCPKMRDTHTVSCPMDKYLNLVRDLIESY